MDTKNGGESTRGPQNRCPADACHGSENSSSSMRRPSSYWVADAPTCRACQTLSSRSARLTESANALHAAPDESEILLALPDIASTAEAIFWPKRLFELGGSAFAFFDNVVKAGNRLWSIVSTASATRRQCSIQGRPVLSRCEA